jgi:protocatechuate 3,4-dioxygenase beta subunit
MDGVRGIYERAIEGTLVEVLWGDTDTVVAQGVTDFEGQAAFESVPPGEYRVRLTLPEGYWISAQGEGTGLQTSSVPVTDSRQGTTQAITLSEGQAAGVSIGGVKTGKISGRVWLDADDDGIMAQGEPGLSGCRITLTGNKYGNTYAYSTDDSGNYSFEVRQDTYVMNVYGPEGMIFARFSLSGGGNRSIFTDEGLREDKRPFELTSNTVEEVANIGFIPEAVLEGVAYQDANYNGVWDAEEAPLSGVSIKFQKAANGKEMGRFVTGEDGAFRFAGLRGGDYRIQATLPDAGVVFTRVPGAGAPYENVFEKRKDGRDNTAVLTMAGGEKRTLGIGAVTPGALSGSVFMDDNFNGVLDLGEKPVAGAALSLLSQDGATVATAATDDAGLYEFAQVMPMDYTLAVAVPAGGMFTVHGQGEGRNFIESTSDGQGLSETIPFTMGETMSGVNAGVILPAQVSGTVFADANDDGLESSGEGGFEGVTVSLKDASGAVLRTASTDKDGAFAFEQLTPGGYSLSYQLPEDTSFAPKAAGGSQVAGEGLAADGETFELQMGESKQAPLCGAVALGRLAGLAFHDINGNGTQDEGEEALGGVDLTLTSGREGGEPQALTTGDDGAFGWTGLRPGPYTIDVSLPSGMIFSREGEGSLMPAALSSEGSQNISLGMGEKLDNRLVGGVKPAALDGSLWLDENNDGRRDEGEAPMAGLQVKVAGDAGGTSATLTTDENGAFAMPLLQPGTYDLTVFLPDNAIAADTAAGENLFEQKESGTMSLTGLTLAEGEAASGILGGVTQYTAIGGTAWADEAGTIAPLAGVQISLYTAADLETPLGTVLTAEDGAYRFEKLMPGDYLIRAALPESYLFVKPDDARLAEGKQVSIITDTAAGSGNAFTLSMGKDQTALDIGAVKAGKLGDLAWLDENENGLQDTGEQGIPGLTVVLVQDGGQVATVMTDAYGYYLFTDVYPMSSRVQVTMYPELAITQHRTDFPILVSALTGSDGENASADDVAVTSGGSNFDCDLGFVLKDKNKRPDAMAPAPRQNWE